MSQWRREKTFTRTFESCMTSERCQTGMGSVKRSGGVKSSQQRRDKALASSVAKHLTSERRQTRMAWVKQSRGGEEPAVEKQGIHEVVESRSTSQRRQTGMGCVKRSGGSGKVVDNIVARLFESRSTPQRRQTGTGWETRSQGRGEEPVVEIEGISEVVERRVTPSNGDGVGETKQRGCTSQRRREKAFTRSLKAV